MATIEMIDGTQMYHDAIRRIGELEKLNSALAAEIDRMRPVVEAAINLGKTLGDDNDRLTMEQRMDRLVKLKGAVVAYEAKDDCCHFQD